MNQQNVPDTIYYPLKVILLVCFILPLIIWAGRLAGLTDQQELALVKAQEQKIGSFLKQEVGVAPVQSEKRALTPGIDVSHYQGKVRWDLMKQSGISFAYIKATGGDTYIDPMFEHNWRGAREAGIPRGAYHFFYPEDDATNQANHFYKTVGQLNEWDLPPVVDIEVSDHVDKSHIQEDLVVYLKIIKQKTGKQPVIYSDLGFIRDYLSDERFAEYPLWVADYSDKLQALPPEWHKDGWKIWQYTQTASVNGIDGHVDMSHFNGNQQALSVFIKHSNSKQGRDE